MAFWDSQSLRCGRDFSPRFEESNASGTSLCVLISDTFPVQFAAGLCRTQCTRGRPASAEFARAGNRHSYQPAANNQP